MIEIETLPFSEDSECGLLCSLLLSPEHWLRYGLALRPELFYIPANRIVYEALRQLSERGHPFDFISVKERLKVTGKLEEIGGAEALVALYRFVPTSANAEFYLASVAECYRRRCALLGCQKLMNVITEAKDDYRIQLAQTVEQTLTELVLDFRKSTRNLSGWLDEAFNEIAARAEDKARSAVQFDVLPLDSELSGVEPGELVVISSETSGGKSALALQAGRATAEKGYGVVIFSLEMSPVQLCERLLSAQGQISMRSLRTGKLSAAELERMNQARAELRRLPITIDENYRDTITQIVSRCRALKIAQQTANLRLVIIDYLQLLGGEPARKDTNREREVAAMSRRLKLMALELNVTVIAISQLNDDGYLRESRAIGHDADIILNIKPINEFGAVEFNLRKVRQGAQKKLTGFFRSEYMTFIPDVVSTES
jgi:replicative DNA helicase